MLKDKVYEVLHTVKDPEITSISVVELGMIESVTTTGGEVGIHVLPTFLGCPALDLIKHNIEQAVKKIPEVETVEVQFVKHPPWTSSRISEEGRANLKKFGIAPPPTQVDASGQWEAECPYCGSSLTVIENLFGPTACRSILYCKSCKNPFEALKPSANMSTTSLLQAVKNNKD